MRRPLAGLLLLLSAACQGGATEPGPVLGRAPADVQAAADTASLAGSLLTAEAFLWRDFQPPRARNGGPLLVAVRVRGVGGASVPDGVQADSLWVVSAGQAWAARAVQEQPRDRDQRGDYLEFMARNGPMWAPETRADVAVRVRDAAGRVAYLRVADRVIARTQ